MMKYVKSNNKIIIEDLSEFNINQILDCGQIFRYYIIDNVAEVISNDKYAQIITFDNRVEILSQHIDYFENFFDLKRNYSIIKSELLNDDFLSPAIKFGYGIRILNQDLFEMIVSFIISANNNIKRIKNSLNYLSKKFGDVKRAISDKNAPNSPLSMICDKQCQYYAFPTLKQLKNATISDYVEAGLGYRAQYMYETVQNLTEKQLDEFKTFDFDQQLSFLLSLKGVGEKVAHCIMLFAMHQTSVFPVDTWINKVYNDLTNTNSTNRKEISRKLTDKYKTLSGYAQQYFFYYYRAKKGG